MSLAEHLLACAMVRASRPIGGESPQSGAREEMREKAGVENYDYSDAEWELADVGESVDVDETGVAVPTG
jgi:hypothetical protein